MNVMTWVVASSAAYAAGVMTPADIEAVFKQYESLNASFLASVESGSGAQWRTEVEEFAEGPFLRALDSAVMQVCEIGNVEVLRSLFRVTRITHNSASESPAWSLGRIFRCQAGIFREEFLALPKAERSALYPVIRFGLENVLYERRDEDTVRLRRQLDGLVPDASK